ncbi:hypothetical protein JZ751_018822, partial [Albula glossodonta]
MSIHIFLISDDRLRCPPSNVLSRPIQFHLLLGRPSPGTSYLEELLGKRCKPLPPGIRGYGSLKIDKTRHKENIRPVSHKAPQNLLRPCRVQALVTPWQRQGNNPTDTLELHSPGLSKTPLGSECRAPTKLMYCETQAFTQSMMEWPMASTQHADVLKRPGRAKRSSPRYLLRDIMQPPEAQKSQMTPNEMPPPQGASQIIRGHNITTVSERN